jgi:hypothetical protein
MWHDPPIWDATNSVQLGSVFSAAMIDDLTVPDVSHHQLVSSLNQG